MIQRDMETYCRENAAKLMTDMKDSHEDKRGLTKWKSLATSKPHVSCSMKGKRVGI